MRRWLLGLAIAVVALLVGLELAVRAVSLEANRSTIESRLTEALGLGVTLGGELHLSVLPQPSVEVSDVKVANLPGRPSPHLLEIGTLELGLALFPLLRGDVMVRRLALVDVDLHLESDARGEIDGPPVLEALAEEERPQDPEQLVHLQVARMRVENLTVFYRDDSAGVVTSAHLARVDLNEEDVDAGLAVELEGEYDGGAFKVEGAMGTVQEILWPTGPYPVSLRGDFLDATGTVDGTIATPTSLEGLDLAFSLEVSDAGSRLREAGVELPVIGPLRASGRLTGSSEALGLAELAIVSLEPDQPIRGRISGSIANLQEAHGVALDVALETSELGILQPLLAWPLPPIDEATLEASVSDEDGSLGIEHGRLRVRAEQRTAWLEAQGRYDDVLGSRELDATLELVASDLAQLGRLAALERPLPDEGPVHATGRLREVSGAFGLEDLAFEVGTPRGAHLKVSGSVGDLSGPARVRLELEFQDPDLRRYAAALGREIPDIGGARGSSVISDQNGTLGVDRFELRAGRGGVLDVHVSAELDDLFEYDGIDFRIALKASDLAVIGALLDAQLPPIGPVEFDGSVSGDDELLRTSGRALLGESRFSGSGSGAFGSRVRPRIVARLRSDHVRLRDLGFLPEESDAAAASPPRDGLPAGDEVLPFERLRVVDLDLGLDFARVTGRAGFDLQSAKVRLKLDAGDLRVSDFSGVYEAGKLDGSFRANALASPPTVGLVLDATGIDLARLAAQLEEEGEASGVLDLSLNLETRGRTLDAQRKQLHGYAGAMLRDGTMASRYARMFILTLRRVAFSRLPLGGVNPTVGCFRAELALEGGVGRVERMVLSGPNVTVDGTGSIDVGRDEFDLTLTPSTRNPALVGVAATVRVTGPLEQPNIRPVARSLATSAVRGVLSNALRPQRVARNSLGRLPGMSSPEPDGELGACDEPLPRQRP